MVGGWLACHTKALCCYSTNKLAHAVQRNSMSALSVCRQRVLSAWVLGTSHGAELSLAYTLGSPPTVYDLPLSLPTHSMVSTNETECVPFDNPFRQPFSTTNERLRITCLYAKFLKKWMCTTSHTYCNSDVLTLLQFLHSLACAMAFWIEECHQIHWFSFISDYQFIPLVTLSINPTHSMVSTNENVSHLTTNERLRITCLYIKFLKSECALPPYLLQLLYFDTFAISSLIGLCYGFLNWKMLPNKLIESLVTINLFPWWLYQSVLHIPWLVQMKCVPFRQPIKGLGSPVSTLNF